MGDSTVKRRIRPPVKIVRHVHTTEICESHVRLMVNFIGCVNRAEAVLTSLTEATNRAQEVLQRLGVTAKES